MSRDQADQRQIPQPIRPDGAGGIDTGPRDIWRDLENPDQLVPPVTDNGLLPNMVFSFSDTHMKLNFGGWSREVTTRELPIAKDLAGVNMYLKPGGVRELHWHQQAEWAFMISGSARITAIDAEGRNYIADVGQGDLWYFPPGLPHSIQGLEHGAEFLLVFDDGNFSDLNTLSISDWMAHTPRSVLAANFGVAEEAFCHLPKDQVYIYQASVPGSLESQRIESPYGSVPLPFSHRLMAQKPLVSSGGTVRIADSTNFQISKKIAAALVEIKPGAMRELHWHPNADEWQYYLSGTGRMTVFGGNGAARTYNVRAGDVGYVPFAFGHYIQNIGNDSIWFLEMFRSDRFADVSLNQWMALTPKAIVESNLCAGNELMDALNPVKQPVVKFPRKDKAD
ncbi:oxalate decarboxylase family bicupin [Paenibacillus pasadenensis]|nr:oxalate decarboxylase family bicupin [Paenibacillus pasadenensis]MCM3747910.1 oxalate decarboxylase family bicupin [Paenibacillus pasadenensis]